MGEDNRYEFIFKMRHGLTSEATLYNGHTDTMEKMLRRLHMVLNCLEKRSLWLYLEIIVKTVAHIVCGRKY